MSKILHDCCYDKAKLLHQLSCCAWFIEKHALDNAQKAENHELHTTLQRLHEDLIRHAHALHDIKCSCN